MDIKQSVMDLNEMISKGQLLEAFDKYYADDVVMQENNEASRAGKEVNRKFEEEFMANVTEFQGAKALNVAFGDNLSMVEWTYSMTHKQWGPVTMNQVAVQTWKDGKIVHERFYYGK